MFLLLLSFHDFVVLCSFCSVFCLFFFLLFCCCSSLLDPTVTASSWAESPHKSKLMLHDTTSLSYSHFVKLTPQSLPSWCLETYTLKKLVGWSSWWFTPELSAAFITFWKSGVGNPGKRRGQKKHHCLASFSILNQRLSLTNFPQNQILTSNESFFLEENLQPFFFPPL